MAEQKPDSQPSLDAGDARIDDLLAGVAGHAWRLSRLARRAIEKLAPQDGARLNNQLRFTDRKLFEELEGVGIRIVDVEGQVFDPGMPVTALNADDFSPSDSLAIDQMIEPIVVGNSGVLKYGVVMLGKIG